MLFPFLLFIFFCSWGCREFKCIGPVSDLWKNDILKSSVTPCQQSSCGTFPSIHVHICIPSASNITDAILYLHALHTFTYHEDWICSFLMLVKELGKKGVCLWAEPGLFRRVSRVDILDGNRCVLPTCCGYRTTTEMRRAGASAAVTTGPVLLQQEGCAPLRELWPLLRVSSWKVDRLGTSTKSFNP